MADGGTGAASDVTVRSDTGALFPAGQPVRLRQATAKLVESRAEIIPVVGAGLAAAAGAPSASALATELLDASGGAASDADLGEVADQLERVKGTVWVQRQVANTVANCRIWPTGTLSSLVRLPSRIVATTNYDDAIADAVRNVSLRPVLFTRSTLNEGLRRPVDGTVHILHLHGHYTDPETLILTRGSYEAAAEDPALQYALRHLAAEYVLVFLGQRVDRREGHIRRDLLWASDTFQRTGPHHVFLPLGELPRDDLQELTEGGTTVIVAPFTNEGGTFEVVSIAAQLIGLGLPSHRPALDVLDRGRATGTYLRVPIIPAGELDDASQRAAWEMLGTAFNGHLELDELLRHPRALLFGAPGSGKTQTLLHAGLAATDRQAVYRSLSDIRVSDLPVSATDVFLSWVAEGSALREGTPRPTRETARDNVYLFLLDGLDEAPREDRPRILRIIADFADRYPHHLFVVASRPYHGSGDTLPASFETFELVPDRTWFEDYLSHVGVTGEQLQRTLSADAPLQDLLRLPIFAVAVADAARRGETLPDSPMQVILYLATTALREETQLQMSHEVVDGWLDALAFIAEVRHGTGLPVALALNVEVAEPFRLEPDERLLDHLIEKVLMVSSGGTVSFPANVVQEARAARALLRSNRGLDLLTAHALITLTDGTRGVHPSWRHPVELLCYDAPPAWREQVARYDARLAARSTPPIAARTERRRAMRTLLDWYDNHLVWWIHGGDQAQLRDDLDAVAALAADTDLRSEAVQWAKDRLEDTERTRRGNALMLLTRLRCADETQAALPAALRDPDSVVRRIAAESHETFGLDGHHKSLRAALDDDPDDLEERALLGEYIRTAPSDDVVSFLVERWRGEMTSWGAGRALDLRFSREEQLRHLENAISTESIVQGWMKHILKTETPWTATEVGRLARLLTQHPACVRRLVHDVRPILRQQLAVALLELWPTELHTARFLLFQASTAELGRLLDDELPHELRMEISDLLERRRAAASAPPGPEQEPTLEPQDKSPNLAAAVAQGWHVVASMPNYALVQQLDDYTDGGELRQLTEREWQSRSARPEWPADDLRRVDDTRIQGSRDTFALLQLAAHFGLNLDRGTWLSLFELGWPGDEFDRWLRDTFEPDWYPEVDQRLQSLSNPGLRQAANVLPLDTMPTDMASVLAARLEETSAEYERGHFIMQLAEASRADVLHRLHGQQPTDITRKALVRVGDCEAERELLEAEMDAPLPASPSGSGDSEWLNHVRCPCSVPLLVDRTVAAESQDADHLYCSALHAALHRAAGQEGIRIYDELLSARPYSDAPFLWFRRVELLDQLLANAVSSQLDDAEIVTIARTLRSESG